MSILSEEVAGARAAGGADGCIWCCGGDDCGSGVGEVDGIAIPGVWVCGEGAAGTAGVDAWGFGFGAGAFTAGVITIPGVCMWPGGVRVLDFVDLATRFRFALGFALRLGATFALGFDLLTPPMTCPSCCSGAAGDETTQNSITSDQLISFLN